MNTNMFKKISYYTILLFVGCLVGVIIEHNLCIGYELSDIFKFTLSKVCELLQSFAFIILVIAVMLKNSIIDLLNKLRDNVDMIAKAWIKYRLHEQESYQPNQDANKIGLGGVTI